MKENNSIRIRTTVNQDKFITFPLNQTFDFLEILSLKLRQEDVYRSMCSDYGMLCGRVSTKDFGIPNAKISIFIPLSEDDENNQLISTLYPYKRTSDKDERGIRYNLLPKDKKNFAHQPVGTFFSKREILDNDLVLEIYEKYYKFSTVTNSAGDYMIFGISIGTHTVHMDIDFSDIGFVSSRPYELIEKGYNKDLFESSNKFRRSTNLDELAQIVTQNKSVEILPFWGNLEQCEVGITRTDFDIQNFEIIPSSVFFGSIYSDHSNNYINSGGSVIQPNAHLWGTGDACHLHPNPGVGEVLITTKLKDGTIEYLPTQKFGTEGDFGGWGNWAFPISMNKSKKVTDEFGNLIDSSDPSKGLPTEIDVRFLIRFDADRPTDASADRRFGYYLVPNMTNNFDWELLTGEYYTMKWKRLYTVRQYIPRYNGGSLLKKTRRFLGIQRGNECPWSLNFPYNRINTNLTGRESGIRYSLSTRHGFDESINVDISNFLTAYNNISYERSYDFYNSWINGSLYSFLWEETPYFNFSLNYNTRYIFDKSEFSEDPTNSEHIINKGFINWPSNSNPWYTSHVNNSPNVFLFATNITDLGSLVENPGEFGTPNAPFLFDELTHTSYKLPGNSNVGFFENSSNIDGTGIAGQIIKPGIAVKETIARTCEIGQTTTIDSNGDMTETFDDPTRKWLCENNDGGNYNNSTHKGNDMKILYNPNNNGKFSYYFYFGMLGGVSNSLGLVKQKFFS